MKLNYEFVTFEPFYHEDGNFKFARCHLRRDDATQKTMPEITSPNRIFNGDIRSYSDGELRDILAFMQSLDEQQHQAT